MIAAPLVLTLHTLQLKTVLSDERYIVHRGTPSFLVCVKGSQFEAEFVAKYSKSK